MNSLTELVKQRYTTKVFDPTFKISDEQINEIKTLLQYTPSSTNSQPWHFVIAGTKEGRERIAKAASGRFEVNAPKILNASHVVVLCSKAFVDDSYLQTLLEAEARDGRFPNEDNKKAQHTGRSFYANLHRFELKDLQQWTEKQIYIALGNLLLGASVLGLDACPMEGFDSMILNQELNLREKGFTSSVIVSLGRHSESDFNKKLPKSRLSQSAIITEI